MSVQIRLVGAEKFHRLARDLKQAGNGQLVKDMSKSMKRAAEPIVTDMQASVRGVTTLGGGGRGGASGRAARAAHMLRRRRNPGERAKLRAHQSSGLRSAVARTVSASVSTAGRTASVRVRSRSSLMPSDQRKLPAHMNTGRWRKPTFGRGPWKTQVVTPGWFDKPADRGGPRVRHAAFNVVIRTINKLG